MEPLQCHHCLHAAARAECGNACRVAVYCGQECANADWIAGHAEECEQIGKRWIQESKARGFHEGSLTRYAKEHHRSVKGEEQRLLRMRGKKMDKAELHRFRQAQWAKNVQRKRRSK